MFMLKRWMVVAGAALVAGSGVAQAAGVASPLAGAVQLAQAPKPDAEPEGTMIPARQPVMGRRITFDLENEEGKVTQDSFPGKYLMLAIGYSSCPDICPTTLFEYGEVMKALKNPDALVPVFVTIDPTNDDAKRLQTYVNFFDDRIKGLTGDMKNIRFLADQLGATFGYRLDGKKLEKPEKGVPYSVYHSALIYLIAPDRRLVDVYDYQLGPEALTQALDEVLGEPAAAAPADASDAKQDAAGGAMKHDAAPKAEEKPEGKHEDAPDAAHQHGGKEGASTGDASSSAEAASAGDAAKTDGAASAGDAAKTDAAASTAGESKAEGAAKEGDAAGKEDAAKEEHVHDMKHEGAAAQEQAAPAAVFV